MPRNMSFALTTDQIKNRTKTVTRRLGWQFLKKGDLVNACVKCMGLKPGEKIERLGLIRIVDVRREQLLKIKYEGKPGCVAEGFPSLEPIEFINMFCLHMVCQPSQIVTRIEFEFVEAPTKVD